MEAVGSRSYADRTTDVHPQTLSERLSAAVNGIGNQAHRIENALGRMAGENPLEPKTQPAPEHVYPLSGSVEEVEHLHKRLSALAERIEQIA